MLPAVIYCCCLALAVAPVWAHGYLPLQDYPNHLARLHILMHPQDPVLAEYYRFDWTPVPNLALELITVALSPFAALTTAVKIYLTLAMAVTSAAPFLLQYAIYRRLTPTPFLGFPLLYSSALVQGFLAFYLSIGLAVAALAAWILLLERAAPWRLLFGAAAGLVLYFSHLIGFAAFALMVGLWEASLLFEQWRRRRVVPIAQLVRRAGVLIVAFAGPVALFLVSRLGGTAPGDAGDRPGLVETLKQLYWSWLSVIDDKAGRILLAFGDAPDWQEGWFATWLSYAAPFVFSGVVLLGLALGRRWPPLPAVLSVATLTAVFVLMPIGLLGGTEGDWRTLIILGFVLVAVVPPIEGQAARRRFAVLVLAAALGLLGARVLVVHERWDSAQRIHRDYVAATGSLPTGARLYNHFVEDRSDPGIAAGWRTKLYIACLAVVYQHAFNPQLFVIPGLQPLSFAPAYREMADKGGHLFNRKSQTVDWPYILSHYGYVLLTSLSQSERPPPAGFPNERLQLVGRQGAFRLYEIVRATTPEG